MKRCTPETRIVSWSVVALLLILQTRAWGAEATDAGSKPSSVVQPGSFPATVELSVGDQKEISGEGLEEAFVADDKLLMVDIPDAATLRLTGLLGGKTQVFYYQHGALKHITVTIHPPAIAFRGATIPLLNPEKLFFIYDVLNSSSFSKDAFYEDPRFRHALTAETPIFGGRFRNSLAYSHDASFGQDHVEDWNFSFKAEDFEVEGGKVGWSLSLLSDAVLSGQDFFGLRIQMDDVFIKGGKTPADSKSTDYLALIGGVEDPQYIEDVSTDARVLGLSYTYLGFVPESLFSEMVNIAGVTYRPSSTADYRVAGIVEAVTHWGSEISLGGGIYGGEHGFGVLLEPNWEQETGLTRARFRYVTGGVERILSGQPYDQDDYFVQVSSRQWFEEDPQCFLEGYLVWRGASCPGKQICVGYSERQN